MSLILPQGGLFLEPFPPCRFTFESQSRARYPVRPERRGKSTYWYMRKVVDGELHNIYLAPSGKLELEMLENAAALIEARSEIQLSELQGNKKS